MPVGDDLTVHGGTTTVGADPCGTDPRIVMLRKSVSRLGRELAGYPVDLPDRAVAEEVLAELAAETASGTLEIFRLRRSLLVISSALGSVSALAGALTEVRGAIDLFGGDVSG